MNPKQYRRFRKIIKQRLYSDERHPDAPAQPAKHYGPQNKKRKFHEPTQLRKGSYKRRVFTEGEIEGMWLGLCALLDYYGGNQSLAARDTGFNYHTVRGWVRKGRMSAYAAWMIGINDNIPFCKEQLRPDINEEGWEALKAQLKDYHRQRVHASRVRHNKRA